MLKRILLILLVIDLAFFPAAVFAGTNIPGFYGGTSNLVPPAANTLPQVQNIVQGVSGLEQVGDNRMIVHQDQKKAVVEWHSFDIGANAWVHFDQTQTEIDPETGEPAIVPQTNWSALNRIYDQKPSQIFGRLSADGEVYLINQNGMLFSPGAQVDVHGLVASSLNIATQDFLDGLMTFAAENYQNADDYDASAAVSNHGTITTTDNGSVTLIGAIVENSGTITAPLGRISLAAGTEVSRLDDPETDLVDPVLKIDGESGRATNFGANEESGQESGQLQASLGTIEMFGRVVNQEGIIKTVTAVQQNGRIELKATDSLTLGQNSLTASPISTSEETLILAEDFKGGEVELTSEGLIDIKGEIAATAGTVSLNATNRVYLDSGSRIDVSGSWVTRPADASVASAQLNSVELKDDQEQKESILQGQTIYFNVVEGSGIGDVSGTLAVEEKTALEHSTKGGQINLNSSGDVIARSGALLDFSGGGIIYEEGQTETTVLVSGNQAYRIGEAPANLTYDAIIGPESLLITTSQRFGMSESHDGTYHVGGVNALYNYSDSYTVGSDAGWLDVVAPVVLLNATLDGSVTAGAYQTEEQEGEDEFGYQSTLGTQKPTAGTLHVGEWGVLSEVDELQPITHEINVTADPFQLSADFTATDALSELVDNVSILSTEIINLGGLNSVNISAEATVVIEEDAAICMMPTGSLLVAGRHVEHHGSINIPEGRVSFILSSNTTTSEDGAYISSTDLGYERIVLSSGSTIDVSGEQVDLSPVASLQGALSDPGHIAGGDVDLQDWSVAGEGVYVMPGALIDVSGGWRLDDSGSVTGGDAGTIRMVGADIFLEGDMLAYSLADADGGTIDLHALQITVAEQTPANRLPDNFEPTDAFDNPEPHLVISTEQIQDTGAAFIELTSVTDLIVEDEVTLLPSTLKLATPGVNADNVNGDTANNILTQTAMEGGADGGLVRVEIDQIGSSGITLAAGKDYDARQNSPLNSKFLITEEVQGRLNVAVSRIAPEAQVIVSFGGAIDISGPAAQIAGTLSAPSGAIHLSATSALADMALTIESGASVSATAGCLPVGQLSTTALSVGYEPPSAGTIALDASRDLILENGAILDVSGSQPVESLRLNTDGSYRREWVAGQAGSIEIEHRNNLQLDGQLMGQTALGNMPGGSLVVKKTDEAAAHIIGSDEIQDFIHSGFDDITIASMKEIHFSNSIDAEIGRKLTLDAPIISAADQAIALQAPWVVLTNTYWPTTETPQCTVGTLTLSGDWIDIQGDVVLSGFDSVNLNAGHDLRLMDYYYSIGNNREWNGRFETAADLFINADRVYPTTQSVFSIVTSGDATTRATVAAPSDDPVFSAGGCLSLQAANILHIGRWYAPMGDLQLGTPEDGRIYLDDDSLLSVSSDVSINLGGFDEEGIVWMAYDKSGRDQIPSVEVESVPESAILIDAGEVIMRDGATIDVSGGGEVFGYHFLPGIEGSVNPLDDCYVIMPGMSSAFPGQAIYLEDNSLVDEGIYTILPESYAFMDGAMILEDLGSATAGDANAALSSQGDALAVGYTLVPDTRLVTSTDHYYRIRSAEEALAEGDFTIEQLTAGSAGTLSVTADTNILNGSLNAASLAGYTGGSVTFGGNMITASATGAQLPEGFFYRSALPDDLVGRLIVDAEAISDGGFTGVTIGNVADTESVVVENGSLLIAANLTIAAADEIVAEAGSQITAVSGTLNLVSPTGSISTDSSASLHAANDIRIDTLDADLNGDIAVDAVDGAIYLTSDCIIIGADSGSTSGMHVDAGLWEKIAAAPTVNLSSRTDILVTGDATLQTAGAIVLDADRIALTASETAAMNVTASQIYLQNTSLAGETASDSDTGSDGGQGTIALDADDLYIHLGSMADDNAAAESLNDLAITGAAALTMDVDKNVVLSGEGGLSTDGDMTITSAGIVTAPAEAILAAEDGLPSLVTADVELIAVSGILTTRANGNPTGSMDGYGGHVTLQGSTVDQAGVITIPAGSIYLTATGSASGEGVFLRKGAELDVAGNDLAGGGSVTLQARNGTVDIAADTLVNVSAGTQGDAGGISILAPEGDVQLFGELVGQTGTGAGADFILDNRSISDFASLAGQLTAGGITGSVHLRARQGDINIAAEDTLSAAAIQLVADGGSIAVLGSLTASGSTGGVQLEIDAGSDIHLFTGSALGADGGLVRLSAATGSIVFDTGARMDVGGSDDGQIYLRALQDGDRLNMDLNGSIDGAAAIYAEGVRVYTNVTSVDHQNMSAALDDAESWIDGFNFQYAMTGINDDVLRILPGIEMRSNADMSVTDAIELSGSTAGVLTLRSAGDLTIDAGIADSREASTAPSWGINLIAGADLNSSDLMSASQRVNGGGNLTIGKNVLVYTGNAPIRFASAGNTELEDGFVAAADNPMTATQMNFNIGSYAGSITGVTGEDLIVKDGGIQTATGEIDLTVAGDLNLAVGNASGAIRTIGEPGDPVNLDEGVSPDTAYWNYTNGGSIRLSVGGDIHGRTLANDAWDTLHYYGTIYGAQYANGGAAGILTLAGGTIDIVSGGDITCAAGLFGAGDLTVTAGKDLNGRFLVSEGSLMLSAYENFGLYELNNRTDWSIEAFDATIELLAQGQIELGTVVNPTVANPEMISPSKWNLSYAEASSVSLTSVTGSVTLTGKSRLYETLQDQSGRTRILPATLSIDAAADIVFENNFHLAPSAEGNLSLTAGGDIRSGTDTNQTLSMSNAEPSQIYRQITADTMLVSETYFMVTSTYEQVHGSTQLHGDDATVATIHAGGDISDMNFYVPKHTELIAQGDITDISFSVQHNNLDDLSIVYAAGDILFGTGIQTSNLLGINVSGPGDFIVAAGNMIDLGTTLGIQALGNDLNLNLPVADVANGEDPMTLTVYSGIQFDTSDAMNRLDDTVTLFSKIQEQGTAYSEALGEGDLETADEILNQINQDVIEPYFDGVEEGQGDIDMVNSQIKVGGNAGEIQIVAAGQINVGKSSFRSSGDAGDSSGIYTEAGGDIDIYANGDLNVNESRIMTFLGGDITAWSQEGNINAGRGSKTSISTPEKKRTVLSDGSVQITFVPPAVGSGVRALTYDPDGIDGPETEPEAGDIYLFAPAGEIDAGEAGIAGSNIVLAATKVVNVQNIEVGGTSVGVPDTGMAATSIGSLAGSGAVSETSKIAEEQAGLVSAHERFSKLVEDLGESLVPKWIAVEVVGFGEDEEEK